MGHIKRILISMVVACLVLGVLVFAGIVAMVVNLNHTEAVLAHKATANEARAKVLSQLDAGQAKAYHDGLAYILSKHQRLGDFTIGQVISDARQRKTDAYFAVQAIRTRRLDVVSTANLRAEAQLSGAYFSNAKIADRDCSLTLDTSDYHWSNSRQQAATKRLAMKMCDVAYKLSGENQREIPDQGLNVYLHDRSGKQLYWDAIQPPESPPW